MSASNGHQPRTAVGRGADAAWWLVDEDGVVLAGPFPSQLDAAVTGLTADGWFAEPGYGSCRPDGTLSRQFSPEDRTWLAHLSALLDRLADDWDPLISDADPLTGLVCEITAAVAEAGLPLHDCAGRTADRALGGVCLTPSPERDGVVVSWTQHDRTSVGRVRGPETDAAVQQTMNAAVAEVLSASGFLVEALGAVSVVRAADNPTSWE
ncbi:hypothetical protein [Modestobacter sp. SYSU DS0511]